MHNDGMSTHRTAASFTVEEVQSVFVKTFTHVGRYSSERVTQSVRRQCVAAMVAKVGVEQTAAFVASCGAEAVVAVAAA